MYSIEQIGAVIAHERQIINYPNDDVLRLTRIFEPQELLSQPGGSESRTEILADSGFPGALLLLMMRAEADESLAEAVQFWSGLDAQIPELSAGA